MKVLFLALIRGFRAGWALLAVISFVLAFAASPLLAQDEDDEDMIIVVEDEEEAEEAEVPTDEVDEVIEIEVQIEVEEEPEPEPTATLEPSPTPKPTRAPTTESMRDVYERGIALYKQKKYSDALEILTKACTVRGAPAWLYGEAHAMRGIILQYYTKTSGHRAEALVAYRYSLDWDPKNKAANRHINQVE